MNDVTVYLVGAGPGDPGLMTVRGVELLESADIVVYDYLANSALVDRVKPGTETVYVGKKGFSAHVTQDQINELLVQKARELEARGGGMLVRLKGGDPFVFGRGGEEALALVAAGIPFEVVPGVTSGIAAPAYAGIPVTHRGVSSSVTFITGHEDPTKNVSAIDWTALARLAQAGGTLCFYMGMRNLEMIAERLMAQGAAAEGVGADLLKTCGPGKLGRRIAVEKGVFTDDLHGIGQLHGHELPVALEGVLADDFHTVRDDHLEQETIARECAFTDFPDRRSVDFGGNGYARCAAGVGRDRAALRVEFKVGFRHGRFRHDGAAPARLHVHVRRQYGLICLQLIVRHVADEAVRAKFSVAGGKHLPVGKLLKHIGVIHAAREKERYRLTGKIFDDEVFHGILQ